MLGAGFSGRSVRKGLFSVTAMVALVAAFGGVGVIMAAYVDGPIADIIDKGTEQVKSKTDYTIDIENKRDLSDLSMLVYHRASNDGCRFESTKPMKCSKGKHPMVCYQNIGNFDDLRESQKWDDGFQKYWMEYSGYPGLEDSYLGRYPSCPGLSSNPIRGPTDTVEDTGNDMEGIFSRERFVVKEPVVLYTNKGAGESYKPGQRETYLEARLAGVSQSSFDYWASKCEEGNIDINGRKEYILYFDTGKDVSSRVNGENPWIKDHFDDGKGAYCGKNGAGSLNYRSSITLCPGDEGYVQVNKGSKPTNTGEASEGLESGNARKYPYIQITNVNGTCDAADTAGKSPIQPDGLTYSKTLSYRISYKKHPDHLQVARLGAPNVFNSDEFEPVNKENCGLSMIDNDESGIDDYGQVFYRNGTIIERDGRFPELNSANTVHYEFDDGGFWENDAKDLYTDYLSSVGGGFDRQHDEDNNITNKEFPFLYGTKESGEQVFSPYGDLICGNLAADGDDPRGDEAVWAVCDEALPKPRRVVTGSSSPKTYVCNPATGEWSVAGTETTNGG